MNNIFDFVYRVFRKEELEKFKKNKLFRGNELDVNSGFIHLSTDKQIKETINKYFKKEQIYIVKFNVSDLEDSLRWEKSRNNEIFPHYYGILQSRLIMKITNQYNNEL
tara:strand:- start:91 stop:414 length:324 start_codon:yes stop_codon:yes gene_type:complete